MARTPREPNRLSSPRRVAGSVDDPAELAPDFSRTLVAWFKKTARDLPWRQTKDAYRIWVSEVMLQQTQVKTVIGYFHAFLDLFPTMKALAAAPEEKVLRAWEGLGYYRRARNLHAAAKMLVKHGHDNLPPDPVLLSTLPGMGEYTRNAVLSQAHGLALPIIEANSQRVLCRILGVQDDPARGPVKKWLWQSAAKLVCHSDPSAYNQALMELGALVCTPQKPGCLICPARPWCSASKTGEPESIPLKSERPAITRVWEVCMAACSGSGTHRSWLLFRRPATASRWAGLWEFAHQPMSQRDTPRDALYSLIQQLFPSDKPVETWNAGKVQHAITRYQVKLRVEVAQWEGKPAPQLTEHDAWAWLSPAEIATLPLSAPQRRVWEMVSAMPF